MPVVSVAGSEFTVLVASVSYSAQITSGTITQTSTITRTRTLGGGNAFTQTDLISREDQCTCAAPAQHERRIVAEQSADISALV